MPRFIITEVQRVYAVREIEADTQAEAEELFDAGEGKEVEGDGAVSSSEIISVIEV